MGDLSGEVSGTPYLTQRKLIDVSMLPPKENSARLTEVSESLIDINKYHKYVRIWRFLLNIFLRILIDFTLTFDPCSTVKMT